MMTQPTFQFNDSEMRDLAEMSALVLEMLATAVPDGGDKQAERWKKLCVKMLDSAHSIPSIGEDMEMNPEGGYWYFKRPYLETAFFEDCIDEYRDSVFWSELVTRMAEQSLMEAIGEDAVNSLSDDERAERCSAMEKALWNECIHHGIDRLMFMLPSTES